MKRWLARALAALILAVVGLALGTGSASADSNNCKAPEVPDLAGAGLQGRIDSRPKNAAGDTLYEQYGWSGMSWHTCDLGEDGWIDMPEAAKDPGAWIDTAVGSMLMGAAGTIGAFMTQLNEWTMDPGNLLAPIDGALTSVAKVVTESVWSPWAGVLVIGAACMIVVWARAGNPRRIFGTVAAILMAATAVSALGATWQVGTGNLRSDGSEITVGKPGAVALGQFFDSAATDVVGEVTKQVTGSADPNAAYGAMLYDDILVHLWVEGAVGPNAGDVREDGTLANVIYRTNTASWAEQEAGIDAQEKKDKYVEIAKILDGKADGTDKIQANDGRYKQLTGKGGGRAGIGFEALVTMLVIAIVRVPASILLLLGLLVIRFVVMFIPIWALFAIIEKTRPTAKTAGKMIFAAVYNAAVFGVFGVVYTAIVSTIIKSPGGYTFAKLVLIIALTIVVWVVTKPFRSVTVPATGDVLASASNAGARGMGMAKSVGAMFLANRLANRGLRGKSGGGGGKAMPDAGEQQANVDEEVTPPATAVRLPQLAAAQPRQKLVYTRRPELPAGAEERPAAPRRELPAGPDAGEVAVTPPAPLPPSRPRQLEVAPRSSDDPRHVGIPQEPTPPTVPTAPKTPIGVPRLPKVEPAAVEVPVEVEYDVIEPSAILEPVAPGVKQPGPVQVDVPVVTVLEQDAATGQWTEQTFREWRPPQSKKSEPWANTDRWRESPQLFRPVQEKPQQPVYAGAGSERQLWEEKR